MKAFKYYHQLKKSNASEDQMYSWVTSHFLRLIIYAKTDLVLVKQETPKYSITDLLSSIGGCLGLWVGVSVLTVSKLFNNGVGVTSKEEKENM